MKKEHLAEFKVACGGNGKKFNQKNKNRSKHMCG